MFGFSVGPVTGIVVRFKVKDRRPQRLQVVSMEETDSY